MWHGSGKPSFSSFFQKFSGPWLRKIFTWEATKNLTEFPRCRLMSQFCQEIDARKPAEDSGEVSGGLKRLAVTAWWPNWEIPVVDRDKLFSQSWTREISEKTWNWRFSTAVSLETAGAVNRHANNLWMGRVIDTGGKFECGEWRVERVEWEGGVERRWVRLLIADTW